jgi:hypothetical protein
MSKKRIVDMTAKEVVDNYLVGYDLCQLVKSVSFHSAWFGRFGRINRELFVDALQKEMRERV